MHDVAISGASFAGLALARALVAGLGAQIRIVLIDRVPPRSAPPSTDPRASAISAASVRFLEAIGAWSALEPFAGPVEEIAITDSRSDSPVRSRLLSYDNHTRTGEPAAFIVENARLRSALADELAGIEIVSPAEIVRCEQRPASILLHLQDGSWIESRLAVAADGRSSQLRDSSGIKSVVLPQGQSAIATTVRHERPHERRAIQHFLPGGPFALLPLADPHRSSIVWSERTRESARLAALDDEAFLAELEDRFGGRLGRLSLDGPRAAFPLETRLARRFVADRLALVGDAARVVHPLAGQGINIGLRDVAALAEIVTDAARLGFDIGGHEPLERYERWRRFDSVASGLAMDGINRLFSNDLAPVRILRDIGLGLVDRSDRLKRFFVAEAAGLTGDLPRMLRGEPL